MRQISVVRSVLSGDAIAMIIRIEAIPQIVAAAWEAVVIRLSVGNDRKLETATREVLASHRDSMVDRADTFDEPTPALTGFRRLWKE